MPPPDLGRGSPSEEDVAMLQMGFHTQHKTRCGLRWHPRRRCIRMVCGIPTGHRILMERNILLLHVIPVMLAVPTA